MRYVIDRIEGDFAVCEDETGTTQDIPLSSLPESTKEGLHLKYENGYYQLVDISKEHKAEIQKQVNRLWK